MINSKTEYRYDKELYYNEIYNKFLYRLIQKRVVPFRQLSAGDLRLENLLSLGHDMNYGHLSISPLERIDKITNNLNLHEN